MMQQALQLAVHVPKLMQRALELAVSELTMYDTTAVPYCRLCSRSWMFHAVSIQRCAAVRILTQLLSVTMLALLKRSSERVAARSTAAHEPHTSSESPVVANAAPRTARSTVESTRGDSLHQKSFGAVYP